MIIMENPKPKRHHNGEYLWWVIMPRVDIKHVAMTDWFKSADIPTVRIISDANITNINFDIDTCFMFKDRTHAELFVLKWG